MSDYVIVRKGNAFVYHSYFDAAEALEDNDQLYLLEEPPPRPPTATTWVKRVGQYKIIYQGTAEITQDDSERLFANLLGNNVGGPFQAEFPAEILVENT